MRIDVGSRAAVLLAWFRSGPAQALPGSESRQPAVGGLAERIETRLGRFGTGLVGLVCCGSTLAAVGVLAWVSGQPWVFPSLAPTVLLVFETPLRPRASPRHTVLGHGCGILIGSASLAVFGLVHAPAATSTGFTPAGSGRSRLPWESPRSCCTRSGAPHPPAGASALIVSLGILRTPQQLAIMFAAVVLVTALAWIVNRLTGVTMPLWSPHPAPHPTPGSSTT